MNVLEFKVDGSDLVHLVLATNDMPPRIVVCPEHSPQPYHVKTLCGLHSPVIPPHGGLKCVPCNLEYVETTGQEIKEAVGQEIQETVAV